MLLVFNLLAAYAVWAATRQRPGTLDEVRTLAAVAAMTIIVGGAAWLT